MSIEHRDIPDSERHEMKGASTATRGTVPVSNGTGGVAFKKLDITNLQGTIPGGVANAAIVTDGTGGFKTLSLAVYASIVLSGAVKDVPEGAGTSWRHSVSGVQGLTSGVNITGGVFTVGTSGIYRLLGASSYTPPGSSTEESVLTIKNLSTGATVGIAGTTGTFVTLTSSVAYVVTNGMSALGSSVLTLDKLLV